MCRASGIVRKWNRGLNTTNIQELGPSFCQLSWALLRQTDCSEGHAAKSHGQPTQACVWHSSGPAEDACWVCVWFVFFFFPKIKGPLVQVLYPMLAQVEIYLFKENQALFVWNWDILYFSGSFPLRMREFFRHYVLISYVAVREGGITDRYITW